jgi:arylsulfatase A-like enzyme
MDAKPRRRFGLLSRKRHFHTDSAPNPQCQGVVPGPSFGYPKYNILLIVCDQIRAPRWLPPGGVDNILTNIAMLRNQSYVFTNFNAAATNCSPSRAAMLTGLYTQQTCIFTTQDPPSSASKPYPPSLQPYNQMVGGVLTPGQGFATIGDVLSTSATLRLRWGKPNYDCVWIGKWHLSANPLEAGSSQWNCNPGGNGPFDYGFQDPTTGTCIACIPTQPGSTFYPNSYPSPNGECNQGNSGDFQGTTSISPIGDTPNFSTCLSSGSSCPPEPHPVTLNQPTTYNQLNDAAVADAFLKWLQNVAPTLSSKWFAAVSFVNPHDISQFPYSFGLVYPSAPPNCTGQDFCQNPSSPPPGWHPPTAGYQAPPAAATPNLYNSVDCQPNGGGMCTGEMENTTVPGVPTLYSSTSQPQPLFPNTAWQASWNNNDQITPYNNPPNTGKPGLQNIYLADSKALTGQVMDVNGWYTFLNYYYWLQACVDQQIGNVLYSIGTNGNPPGLQHTNFWGNTIIIFTADHGEYGGSHTLHAKGGALYEEAINIPLYISVPTASGGYPSSAMYRSFVCSNVDLLPYIYSAALGNESWRCLSTDMINYLNGRESIMDAIYLDTSAQQRRLSTFPVANPQYTGQTQPYILHTSDEYWYLNGSVPHANPSPHAVAFRTVDTTVATSEQNGPFGGGKLGIYSYWSTQTLGSTTLPIVGYPSNPQQFEFYNYQQNAPANSGLNPLQPNVGEVGNDYWNSNQPGAIAAQYIGAYNPSSGPPPYQANELGIVYPQIGLAYANALNAWTLYTSWYLLNLPQAACNNAYFNISVPAALSVNRGSNGSITVSTNAVNNFNSPIALSVSGSRLRELAMSCLPQTRSLPAAQGALPSPSAWVYRLHRALTSLR